MYKQSTLDKILKQITNSNNTSTEFNVDEINTLLVAVYNLYGKDSTKVQKLRAKFGEEAAVSFTEKRIEHCKRILPKLNKLREIKLLKE